MAENRKFMEQIEELEKKNSELQLTSDTQVAYMLGLKEDYNQLELEKRMLEERLLNAEAAHSELKSKYVEVLSKVKRLISLCRELEKIVKEGFWCQVLMIIMSGLTVFASLWCRYFCETN